MTPRKVVIGCIVAIVAVLLYMSPAFTSALVIIASIMATFAAILSICVYFVWVCIDNEWQNPVEVMKDFLRGLFR